MSNDEFETYLALVSRLLRLSPDQREQIGEELRDHLESRVAELMESGVDRQAALLQAVEEFGDATVLAENLKAVSLVNRKRWMMRFMTMCTAGLFFMAILTMAMWPENARFGAPGNSVAQEETTAADGFTVETETVAAHTNSNVELSTSTQATNEIRTILSQMMDFDFNEETFSDVRTKLEQDLNINLMLTTSAMDDSLEFDTLISASLQNVSVADGLRLILGPHNATFYIGGNVVQIISRDDADSPEYFRRKMIRVGNLLDLIKQLEADRIGTPRYPGADLGAGAGGGGGLFCVQGLGSGGSKVDESVQGVVGIPASPADAPKISGMVELITAESLLIDAIQTTVSADAWYEMGQGEAALTCVGGVLILHANESLISEVEDFVTDLEFELQSQVDR